MKIVGTVDPGEIVRASIVTNRDDDGNVTSEFWVGVAYISRMALREVEDKTTPWVYEQDLKRRVPNPNAAAYAREFMRRLLPVGGGLTPAIFLDLADLSKNIEFEVELDADGCIPWDHDRIVYTERRPGPKKEDELVQWTIPAMLFQFAPAEKFKLKVEKVAKDWKELRDAEKKTSLPTSNDSAA